MKKRLFGSLGAGFFALGIALLRGHQEQVSAECGPNGIYCACTDFTNWNQTGSREQVGTGPINTGGSWLSLHKPSFAIDGNNIPYIAMVEKINSTYRNSVYRYEGTWQRIGLTNFSSIPLLEQDSANPALDIDTGNNVYVVAVGTGTTGVSMKYLSLFKYNGTTSTWSTLGTYGLVNAMYFKLRVAANNVVYIAYKNNSNSTINALKYENGTFTSLGVVNTGSTGGASNSFDMELDHNGILNVGYIDHNSNTARVRKYVSNSWQSVGTNISSNVLYLDLITSLTGTTGSSSGLKLLISKSGISELFRYNNSSRSSIFSIVNTGNQVYGSIAADSNNFAYMAFNGKDALVTTFTGYLHRLHLSPYSSQPLPGGFFGMATIDFSTNNMPYVAVQKIGGNSAKLEVRRITCSTPATGGTNGSCGSANGVPSYTQPYTGACATGNLTGGGLSGSTRVRQCQGSNGGTTASCSAPKKIDAVCGVANGGTFTTFPDSSLLCSVGSWSNTSTTSTNYYWQCDGINGGLNVSCQANVDNCYPGSPNCR